MSTYLITLDDIKNFKPISLNVNETKQLKPFILEAQEFELKEFLGDEFYLALVADFNASPSLATYGDLFNGVQYTYNGTTYENTGIKPMLIYYAYARYLNNANPIITANGIVQKNNSSSTPVSEKTIARLVNQATSGGKVYENRVVDYLVRKSSSYPLYDCITPSNRTGGLRISSVRKR